MRAVITGSEGFVGRWLRAWLGRSGDEVLTPRVDVTDVGAISAALSASSPDVVFHLAAISVPRDAEADPARAMEVNAGGTRNVLAAAEGLRDAPLVFVTSSAAVYDPSAAALTEGSPTRAGGAYIESKLASEAACSDAAARGLRVIVARPFNHTGPGQSEEMVVPALAKGVIDALGCGERAVKVGNLDVRRDIGDVRDVVRAYRLLAEHAQPGTFNVCTGKTVLLRDIATRLAELVGAPDIEFRSDPQRVRPGEPEIVVGDPSKLRAATGWQPEIDIGTTLGDVFAWWKSRRGQDGEA